jgi:hypothetical protein
MGKKAAAKNSAATSAKSNEVFTRSMEALINLRDAHTGIFNAKDFNPKQKQDSAAKPEDAPVSSVSDEQTKGDEENTLSAES